MEQMILSKNNKQTNKKKKRNMAKKRRLGVLGGRGEGVRGMGLLGVLGCKLLYLEWMGNGILLYSTGKCE